MLLPVNIGVVDDKNRLEPPLLFRQTQYTKSQGHPLSAKEDITVASSSGFNETFLRDWSTSDLLMLTFL